MCYLLYCPNVVWPKAILFKFIILYLYIIARIFEILKYIVPSYDWKWWFLWIIYIFRITEKIKYLYLLSNVFLIITILLIRASDIQHFHVIRVLRFELNLDLVSLLLSITVQKSSNNCYSFGLEKVLVLHRYFSCLCTFCTPNSASH